jgi:hypothetical protein
MARVAAVVAFLLLGLPAAADSAPARTAASDCGTYRSSSAYNRARVIAIRGVSCRTARRVARRYDRRGKTRGPWRCGLAHGGGRRLFSCGYPATGGDLRDSRHALSVRGVRGTKPPRPVF